VPGLAVTDLFRSFGGVEVPVVSPEDLLSRTRDVLDAFEQALQLVTKT